MTNHPWSFSIRALKSDLGVESLRVVNDFAAIALSIPRLGEDDRALILSGRAGKAKPIAVIGPGTGLGVSALIPMEPNGSWHILSSEGGHVSMAARGKRQAALLSWIEDKYGHASAERVLSGPGLVALHDGLSALERLRAFHPAHIAPDQISANALSRSCPICVQALDLFLAMLGTMAGNLALTLGAEGGIYIAGGIVPRLIERLKASAFAEHFYDKGRFRDYLQSIPVFVITHPHPAFPGLAELIAPLKA